MPDFEWVDEVIPFEPAADASTWRPSPDRATERFIEVPRDTRRGVGWVLAWAGAIAVLAIAAGVLTEFAYVLAAERTLVGRGSGRRDGSHAAPRDLPKRNGGR